MKHLWTATLLLLTVSLAAQDTLTYMHYNILYYGENNGGCNSSSNGVTNKNTYLKTITGFVKPDILAVNEISSNAYYHNLLLTSVFNINGVDYYAMGNPPNLSGSFIINQIFYNSEKLTLLSDHAIETDVRDIDIFRFHVHTPNLEPTGDSVILHCVVAHLKAGSESSDANERAAETAALMNHLEDVNAAGNYTMSGDFNIYKSSEQAFQNLINYASPAVRFYDPIDMIGYWHSNEFYAPCHTQSTHTSGNGCPSTGGMDDRFDFVLASDEILYGTDAIQYIPGTYHALAQDGERFNMSLIDPPANPDVPVEVINALYSNSDHLPVIMKLAVDKSLGIRAHGRDNGLAVKVINPMSDRLQVDVRISRPSSVHFELYSSTGLLVSSQTTYVAATARIEISVAEAPAALYLLKVSDEEGSSLIRKVMKAR
jgi:hypothetical protein